ncbi:unconventional myosin-X-like isoform X2 [Xenia sp. Carnegie-2017]|nr:unconventional myosin-X-like isoform X2 [Xenia sp. Carnegie-2017]
MESFFETGNRVWLLDDKEWSPSVVEAVQDGKVTFRTEYGKVIARDQKSLSRENVSIMHNSSVEGVEDMAHLEDLHEAGILHNLHVRYKKDLIYTYIGSILAAVNPYRTIEDFYTKEIMTEYSKCHLGEKPPHIFAIANECYYSMIKRGQSQCVLISGESGAGKTESTKFMLNFLSHLSSSIQASGEKDSVLNVEDAILKSSPILEAFGNAKTVYNNNSSRFGKFIQLFFNERGRIVGGKISDFLLEKNRLARQNPDERNYHIFYALVAGVTENEKNELRLLQAEKYHYLNQSGCISDSSINDKQDFFNVLEAMRVMRFKEEHISDVLHVLAGILNLGNVTFITGNGAQINEKFVLEDIAELLQVDIYDLEDVLTQRSMVLRGEEIKSPLTIPQAEDSRDSMSMALYACTFKWIIQRINARIKGTPSQVSIGILDIFGFENFETNRFEQFNINYANEKLQQFFNKHIFSLEQHEYNREGLEWADIDWVDNGECLDLIEKKVGVLSLFDEESRFPKGTDASLLEKLHASHEGNKFYLKPKVANKKFGIKHYAGDVYYTTTGFLEKNRDTFRDDLLNLLQNSRSDFVYDLFEHMKPTPGANSKSSKRRPTVGSQFRTSLTSLMTTLSQAHPYFVRCIKPNGSKMAEKFDPKIVLDQLRYSGMLETVRIRRAGFPVRIVYADFAFSYKVLLRGKAISGDPMEDGALLLDEIEPTRKRWKIGKTKMFLKDELEVLLDKMRDKALKEVAKVIKRCIVGYLARKRFLKQRAAILLIQKVYRAHFYRNKFLKKRQAAIVLQKYERRRAARKLLLKLLEEKRIEEERIREEQRRKEEERRREMERLEQQRRMEELEELKRKAEEEARRKREEEEERLRKEELQKQAMLAKAREIEEARRIEEARKAEEEAKRRQEEEERRRIEEEERLKAEEDERRRQEEAEEDAISLLDNALKQTEEASDDEEEDDEAFIERSPSIIDKSLELPYKESYLTMKEGGILNQWKRYWCILRDETLMWFRGKLEALKAGWLQKKGGGTGTLSRRNWKRRWFVLKDTILSYYENDAEGAKALGSIDIKNCQRIVDSGEKENAFSIVTDGRTYHVIAESAHDWNQWFNVLNRVHRASELELRDMKEESANIKHALGTIDVPLIESCSRGGVPGKPNSFTIITANRLLSFSSDSAEDADSWVSAILKTKEREAEEGFSDVLEQGWLIKEGPNESRRKRWFVLTGNSLDYYKSYAKGSPRFGSILLNSLCSVIPPSSQEDAKEGDYVFDVNGRKRTYILHAKNEEEGTKWTSAIQDVIESKPTIETPFSKLITEVKNAHDNEEVDKLYQRNPILRYTKLALRVPLLALPYGYSQSMRAKDKGYGTFHEEAIRIFSSLQEQESIADPIPVIQGILQTCHDLKPLRDEVFCQLIKQTTSVPNIDSIGNLKNWQVLVCMCCTFIPSRKILRYLRSHLRRSRDQYHETEMAKFAIFCLECIKRTRPREFPPSRAEIIACLGRRDLATTVYTFGEGAHCKIEINSATTAGAVVHRLCKGLNITQHDNLFGLFEKCGSVEKHIEGRTVVADVLAKFERYKALRLSGKGQKWQLFFKIFCFLNPSAVQVDSVEGLFLFEQ